MQVSPLQSLKVSTCSWLTPLADTTGKSLRLMGSGLPSRVGMGEVGTVTSSSILKALKRSLIVCWREGGREGDINKWLLV